MSRPPHRRLVDWPRVLENPPTSPEHLERLGHRCLQWATLCQLCVLTGEAFEVFDRSLMRLVREFLTLVRSQQWEGARLKYKMIRQLRGRLVNVLLQT